MGGGCFLWKIKRHSGCSATSMCEEKLKDVKEIEVPEYSWKNEKRSRKGRCQGKSGKIVNI